MGIRTVAAIATEPANTLTATAAEAAATSLLAATASEPAGNPSLAAIAADLATLAIATFNTTLASALVTSALCAPTCWSAAQSWHSGGHTIVV